MNKRQRKKKFKKKLKNYIMGIDLANNQDYTILPNTVARFIYNKFNIPEEYMKERTKDTHLQFEEYLKINRIVIGGD